MKKIILTILIILIGITVVKAETVYTTTKLNVRVCASKKCRVHKVVNKNTKLNKVGIKNGWAKVKINNKVYYIYNRYLKTTTNKKIIPTQLSNKTTGNKSELQQYAYNLVKSYGWSEYDYECLIKLWNRESGWRPNAVNKKSGACGIPQALPCKKMSKEGSDYRTNGKTQIRWGLKYIKSRYGSPSKAWAHSQRKGWY